MQQFDRVLPVIGHTPLLEIRFVCNQKKRRIFAKAEWFNMTGSIKDRVAHYILRRAYEMGEITPGMPIAEATSGNTGISFSAMGCLLGHPVTIYMPDWMSAERIRLMESYGAKVVLVSREEGGFLGSIAMAEEMGKRGAFLPRQFSNPDNTVAHEKSTAQEIVEQLRRIGLTADGVVAGVGTGGTVMGLGNRLRAENAECRVHPLEPANSPTLSTGYKVGKHRIYGISDEFIPDLVKLDQLSSVVSVDDGDAITMAQMLSRRLGLGVGVSSGANFLGCIKAQEALGIDSTFVTVFADDSKKYLSTDYAKMQCGAEDTYLKGIELTEVIAHPFC